MKVLPEDVACTVCGAGPGVPCREPSMDGRGARELRTRTTHIARSFTAAWVAQIGGRLEPAPVPWESPPLPLAIAKPIPSPTPRYDRDAMAVGVAHVRAGFELLRAQPWGPARHRRPR